MKKKMRNRYFSKVYYKDFFGADLISGLLLIFNGILDVVLWPIGCRCSVQIIFSNYRTLNRFSRHKHKHGWLPWSWQMPYFDKLYAKEFFGCNAISGLLMILNGILDTLLWPFGYRCDIFTEFCFFRLRKSVEAHKLRMEREANR